MDILAPLRTSRSLAVLAALLVCFLSTDLVIKLVLWPLVLLVPALRLRVISLYMRFAAWWVLALLRLGGARFEFEGRIPIPTDGPALIVMNHQSLVDIPVAVHLSSPNSPAIVTRSRYRSFVPLVSPMLAMRRCPLVDPDRGPKGAIATLKKAAAREVHGILIYPEEHRSRDGSVHDFNAAGIRVILRERRMPVYLVVTDGLYKVPTLSDFVLHMSEIRGRAEVLGPLDPPADDADLEAFVGELRSRAIARIESWRGSAHAGA
jgi:1-acyl-sn-glycerol-3-phosphate acyltransferase